MASYDYSTSGDFPDGKLNSSVFHEEIDANESIVTPLTCVDTIGNACWVRFDGDLSGGEKTALDALVAAHDGNFPTGAGFLGFRSASYSQEKTTTAVNQWQEAIKLEIPRGSAGTYKIMWSAEAKKTGQGSARMRVLVDTDEDPLTDVDIDTIRFSPVGGDDKVILNGRDAHIIYMDIVRNGDARAEQSGTAVFRKLNLSCQLVG